MKTRSIAVAVIAFAAAGVGGAAAEGDGDAFRGKAYAGAMCGSCHALSAEDGPSADPLAPGFHEFAVSFDTGEHFVEWFNEHHPQVHGPQAKPEQAQDIIAYTASLKAEAE